MTNDRLCAGSSNSGGGPCPDCGFTGAEIPIAEAVAVLRGLPRRWRSALTLDFAGAHRDPEAMLVGRPGPGAWSALEHAGHVRDVIHALDIRVQRVLREDEPVLPGTHVTPPVGANEQGAAVVLAALTVSVDQLAHTIQVTPAGQWARTGVRGRQRLSALDLVQEAVHEAVHHLALARAAIGQLRQGAPATAG